MRSLLRFLDVKTDRTPLSPRLKSRPNRLAQLGMSRPNLVKAFLKNHVQGLSQTKKMMCRGGTIKILIEYFRIDPGQKIPVRGHKICPLTSFDHPVIEIHETQPRRGHQTFLAPCHHQVHPPGIHLKSITGQTRHAINHQQSGMTCRANAF